MEKLDRRNIFKYEQLLQLKALMLQLCLSFVCLQLNYFLREKQTKVVVVFNALGK